jgi:GR25 family glycosyltransferase involved in LPS biosynthesis
MTILDQVYYTRVAILFYMENSTYPVEGVTNEHGNHQTKVFVVSKTKIVSAESAHPRSSIHSLNRSQGPVQRSRLRRALVFLPSLHRDPP